MTADDNFRSLPFINQLPASVAQAIAPYAFIEQFPAGTLLFREGTPHDSFSIVIAGRIGLEMHVPGRGALRILSIGRGDVLAWSSLLSGGAMTASATALDDSRLLSASSKELLALSERDHEVGYYLFSKLAGAVSMRLLATRLQLLDLYTDEHPRIDPDRHAEPLVAPAG
jgi:CRP/FNR family cyclic AMP-dependent transcriptional regulator